MTSPRFVDLTAPWVRAKDGPILPVPTGYPPLPEPYLPNTGSQQLVNLHHMDGPLQQEYLIGDQFSAISIDSPTTVSCLMRAELLARNMLRTDLARRIIATALAEQDPGPLSNALNPPLVLSDPPPSWATNAIDTWLRKGSILITINDEYTDEWGSTDLDDWTWIQLDPWLVELASNALSVGFERNAHLAIFVLAVTIAGECVHSMRMALSKHGNEWQIEHHVPFIAPSRVSTTPDEGAEKGNWGWYFESQMIGGHLGFSLFAHQAMDLIESIIVRLLSDANGQAEQWHNVIPDDITNLVMGRTSTESILPLARSGWMNGPQGTATRYHFRTLSERDPRRHEIDLSAFRFNQADMRRVRDARRLAKGAQHPKTAGDRGEETV